jgi:DNA-binding NtrC family response regulator
VQTLLDHRGNKAKGAGSLGISRATIYRKIHEYGIITPLAIAETRPPSDGTSSH